MRRVAGARDRAAAAAAEARELERGMPPHAAAAGDTTASLYRRLERLGG